MRRKHENLMSQRLENGTRGLSGSSANLLTFTINTPTASGFASFRVSRSTLFSFFLSVMYFTALDVYTGAARSRMRLTRTQTRFYLFSSFFFSIFLFHQVFFHHVPEKFVRNISFYRGKSYKSSSGITSRLNSSPDLPFSLCTGVFSRRCYVALLSLSFFSSSHYECQKNGGPVRCLPFFFFNKYSHVYFICR